MKMTRLIAILGLALFAQLALAQTTTQRIRGTITALDGNVLSVKTRDGQDIKINLPDNVAVAAAKAVKLADFKPDAYLGVTARINAAGALVASEVHTLGPAVPSGHTPWDSAPGDTMTNANLAKVVKTAAGNELTMEFKGGSKQILVPDGTPIVDFVLADKSLLVPGATIFTGAQVSADGKISAARIAVSKDGVKPPQ
ncbi:MAG: hypothetical protein NT115_19295 [Proteobacteria bacterium]|nr:hypothetical protein [Pseudomonadota bacterium]